MRPLAIPRPTTAVDRASTRVAESEEAIVQGGRVAEAEQEERDGEEATKPSGAPRTTSAPSITAPLRGGGERLVCTFLYPSKRA